MLFERFHEPIRINCAILVLVHYRLDGRTMAFLVRRITQGTHLEILDTPNA